MLTKERVLIQTCPKRVRTEGVAGRRFRKACSSSSKCHNKDPRMLKLRVWKCPDFRTPPCPRVFPLHRMTRWRLVCGWFVGPASRFVVQISRLSARRLIYDRLHVTVFHCGIFLRSDLSSGLVHPECFLRAVPDGDGMRFLPIWQRLFICVTIARLRMLLRASPPSTWNFTVTSWCVKLTLDSWTKRNDLN